VSGAVAAGLATFVGLVFLFYGVGQGLTHLSYDLPFAFRPDVKPDEAIIIYMDEDSHYALKQPFDHPWDRSIHAQLLDRLKACSVKAVAFDVFFDTRTTNDSVLIAAIKRHGKVVLGAELSAVGIGGGIVLQPTPPLDDLRAVAAWGVGEGTEMDEVVRKHYLATHSTNVVSLAWRTAELVAAGPMPNPFTERWLNYYGPPGTIPGVSYVSVLSNSVPLDILSNKAVFVGARIGPGYSGGKKTDDYLTPCSRGNGSKSAGVEIVATAYLNLRHGEWLNELSASREFLLVLAAGIIFGFALPFFRPVPVAVISIFSIAVVFGIAYAFVWRERVWFPWAIISFVQIPCAAACAVLFRTQKVHQEKQALEKELATRLATATNEPVPLAAGRTPPMRFQQQMRDVLYSASPVAAANAPVAGVSSPPVMPDCTLLRCIGVGAYGEVWLGITVLGAYRAVKIIYRGKFEEDRPYEREFEGIKNFDPISRNHPGLVHLLHVGRNDTEGHFHYLMELADDCSGATAFDAEKYEARTLGKDFRRRGRLPVDECIGLGLALTDSLRYLHEHGLIHRDIKPANIIFVGGVPKLADIGLVTQIGEGRTFVGTEGYYPPEGPGSPAGDLYSLGKVLYEAYTGLHRDKFPDLPTGVGESAKDANRFRLFNKIILKACESNVRKRYADARQMHEDLKQLTGKPAQRWKRFLKRSSG
jgi:CHASE2 domain-containing sensor protein